MKKENMKKENDKSVKSVKNEDMSLAQYSAMRLCEIVGQKDYKGSSSVFFVKDIK